MDRRVTPPKRVITSPTWGPPPPCKQALRFDEISPRSLSSRSDLSGRNIARPDLRDITNLAEFLARSLYLAQMSFIMHGEISSRSQRNYKSRRVLGEISFISQKSLSYRRDLVCLAEISFISARSRQYLARDRFHLVPISETLQISPSS